MWHGKALALLSPLSAKVSCFSYIEIKFPLCCRKGLPGSRQGPGRLRVTSQGMVRLDCGLALMEGRNLLFTRQRFLF